MSLVLFDLDGTLIDSEAGIVGSMEHAFARLGASAPPRAVLRTWIGPPLRQTFPHVVGTDPARVEEAVRLYRQRFDAIGWSEHRVYPGIEAVVTTLVSAGRQLAVVTTKVAVQARRIVRHLPFGHAFARVYGPGADGAHCEKADLIAQALEDFGAIATETCMVGDRRFDIEGARANGVRGIGVTWGFGSENELRAAGAEAIARTPADLADLA